MTDVVLPQYGMGMADGTIIVWHKAVGDHVEAGEPLCDVEAAKTTVEVGASISGIVQQILVPAGSNVQVNTVIAVIGDEAVDPLVAAGAPKEVPTRAVDPALPVSVNAERGTAPILGSQPKGQIEPRARRAARLHGVDLATIKGSGPGGRIIEEDVVRNAPVATAGISAPSSSVFCHLRFRCDAQPVKVLLSELVELRGHPVPPEALLVKATTIALNQAGIVEIKTALRRSDGSVVTARHVEEHSILQIAAQLASDKERSHVAPALMIEYHEDGWLDEAISFGPGDLASLSVTDRGQEWGIGLAITDQTMNADQAKGFCKALRDLLLNPLAILA